jgi:hypothetical protein
MDLYIYFYYGPASVGGCASPYFLESAAAIQKAVKDAECTNRLDLRKRNEKEQLEKMEGKKGRKTPQEKSEYQAEVLLLMKQAVMHAKLKAHVASASTASTAGSLSSPSVQSAPSDGSGT